MDASKAQHVGHEQSIWWWVLVGTIGLALVGAILVALETTGSDTVRAPVTVDAPAQVRAPVGDYPLHGRGQAIGNPASIGLGAVRTGEVLGVGFATAVREGGDYAGTAPIGTPDSFTDVRESGAYYGAGTATPQDGRCPVKAGC
jgi:hypothetical protein